MASWSQLATVPEEKWKYGIKAARFRTGSKTVTCGATRRYTTWVRAVRYVHMHVPDRMRPPYKSGRGPGITFSRKPRHVISYGHLVLIYS